MQNLFSIANLPAHPMDEEIIQTLLRGDRGLRVERIISNGHVTQETRWYDQDEDEWVLVLQGSARLLMEDATEVALKAGDHVLLPAHKKHRVVYTSSPCILLAICHSKLQH